MALREDLTGHYEGMRPAGAGRGGSDERRPAGDVTVVEYADEDRRTVTLTWRADGGGRDGGDAPGD